MHECSQASLLVFYYTTANQQYAETLIRQKLLLDQLPKKKVSSFSIVSLRGDIKQNEVFSTESLKEGIKWAAQNTPRQPELSSAFLNDLIDRYITEGTRTLFDLYYTYFQEVKINWSCLLSPCQEAQGDKRIVSTLPTPNAFITQYNALLKALENHVADYSLNDIPWPIPEFPSGSGAWFVYSELIL